MLCKILVSGVDVGLISAGFRYPRFGVIGDQDFTDAPQELKGMGMSFDPGGQIFSRGSFYIGVVTGS